MYCIKCGKQIPEGQIVCNDCTLALLEKDMQPKENAPQESAPGADYTAPVVNINEEPVVYEYEEPVSAPNIPYQPVNAYIPTPKPKAPKSPCSAKSTVAFILSCVAFYCTLQILPVYTLSDFILYLFIIPPVIISIIFGTKSLSGCKVYTEIGVLKDTRTFVFGLIGMIQGIVSASLLTLGLIL